MSIRFVLTFLVSVLAAVALGAPAQAAPCWETVIEDWFDNSRVDRTYPVRCYQQALANLPEDMRAYSSAPEDIARAMRQAIARENQSNPTTTGSGDDGQTAGGVGGNGKGKPQAPIGTTEPGAAQPPAAAPDSGLFREAFDEIGPSEASSFPLPLAVLLGVALLLLAAGGMGLIARRMRPPRPPLTRR